VQQHMSFLPNVCSPMLCLFKVWTCGVLHHLQTQTSCLLMVCIPGMCTAVAHNYNSNSKQTNTVTKPTPVMGGLCDFTFQIMSRHLWQGCHQHCWLTTRLSVILICSGILQQRLPLPRKLTLGALSKRNVKAPERLGFSGMLQGCRVGCAATTSACGCRAGAGNVL
jgi:hypothetical protein